MSDPSQFDQTSFEAKFKKLAKEISTDMNQEQYSSSDSFIQRINQLSEMTKKNLSFAEPAEKQFYSSEIDKLYKAVDDKRLNG